MLNIKIENLKSLSLLEFKVPENGVNVLTGINGCGKTTLLTCLERLANSYAFQRHFKTSTKDQFDNFRNARITYSFNGTDVKYVYRNTRWVPNPRANAAILAHTGFNQVVYIVSSGERFYVQNEELSTSLISAAPAFFKDSMNAIFQTEKYTDLRRVKLKGRGRGGGRWNYGFVLPTSGEGGQNRYYTEKNFSLGEVSILNALFELNDVRNNSLVLIDEVELALHPKVQVRFLRFLEAISNEKNLTVIISTHSSSLIKSAPILIHLDRALNGVVNVDYDCFPALVLQDVAVEEEIQPDMVFFVEDTVAKGVLDELLNYYFVRLYDGPRPIIKVLPVGGWVETMKLAITSNGYLMPRRCRCVAFLDIDAQESIQQIETKADRTVPEQEIFNSFTQHENDIKFLPITPELGIVELLRTNSNAHIASLRSLFNATFDITEIIEEEQNRGLTYPGNARKAAKLRMGYYIDRIKVSANRDGNQVRVMLAQYFVGRYGAENEGRLRGIFNPIFR